LRDAVVDAAGVGSGVWLSYIFVFLYLAIAAWGVTHRDLFFENRVKLPFLNVDLPLIGFFVVGPLLFVIVHAYTLLHFTLLARKACDFDVTLRQQIDDEDIRQALLRRQLPVNILVQFLCGPREARTGRIGWSLRLITWISLVAGPILLLVFFQLQFLPYHSEAVSWGQRFIVVFDLILIWVLWPWADFRRRKVVACLAASFVPVLLVFTIGTFPGEWLEENVPSLRLVPTTWAAWTLPSIQAIQTAGSGWATVHELLVAGAVDGLARRPRSPWSNRLVLPGIDVIDHIKFDTEAKISALNETISLRGRHLEGAVLSGAHLRKVDLTGAKLEGALLFDADLREAKFDCDLEVSDYECSKLRSAILADAQLQGASLMNAQLQGANLDGAQLQGASLYGAHLQGAALALAQLQGADLSRAELQGATLDGARLQGALLGATQLQGAWLTNAQLQGAWLDETQLQGARLDRAELQSASLTHIFVWRADVRRANNGQRARVVSPETGGKYGLPNCSEQCDWSPGSFAALNQLIEQQVPEVRRADALKRVAALDPTKPFDGEAEVAAAWSELARSSLSLNDYESELARSLRATYCDFRGAPFEIRQLLPHLPYRFQGASRQPAALAAAFIDEEHCPGARGLSDEEKFWLQGLRDQFPTALPTPR
jgi:uncharacterized protein YjbI with pentapeptide repeats